MHKITSLRREIVIILHLEVLNVMFESTLQTPAHDKAVCRQALSSLDVIALYIASRRQRTVLLMLLEGLRQGDHQ